MDTVYDHTQRPIGSVRPAFRHGWSAFVESDLIGWEIDHYPVQQEAVDALRKIRPQNVTIYRARAVNDPNHVLRWVALPPDLAERQRELGRNLRPQENLPNLLIASAQQLLSAAHEAGLVWQVFVDDTADLVRVDVHGIAARSDNTDLPPMFIPWVWDGGRLTYKGRSGYRVSLREGLSRIRALT